MAKTCILDTFYLRKIFHARAHAFRCYPFFVLFAFVQWWLRLNSAEHKTAIMNLEIRAFYLPFVFCSAQSHLKTSRPYQTSKHLRNTPLLAEKMVTINKLLANSQLIDVIKRLGIYLLRHLSGINKLNHIVENIPFKNKCKYLKMLYNVQTNISNSSSCFCWGKNENN